MATWRVGAARDLPIIERASWDGQAAKDSIFRWAGFDGDSPDSAKARRGFLVYDAEEPELRGSYKLPFAMFVDGQLRAVDAGLRAAASRLPQTDIPADVANRARSVLDAYFERMEEGESSVNISAMRTFPARIVRQGMPLNWREILLGGYDLNDIEPYFFGAEISNDRLDAYFTRMDKNTTLQNFRDDAKVGVSFLDSHDTGKLGMGQTLDATFEDNGEDARVLADIYTVPGIRFGGQHSFASTDDFIRAVQTGIVRDVSVGFYGGNEICDICGDSVWGRTDCPHIPGLEFPIGERGEQMVRATATIVDARLAEVSAVYDGATPEAMIDKAMRLSMAGELDTCHLMQLERRYRMRLKPQRLWKVNGGKIVSDKLDQPAEMTEEIELTQVRAILSEVIVPAEMEDQPANEVVRWLTGEYSRLQPLEAEVERLRPLADDGRQYRDDLVAEALVEGVRAFGEDFREETYKGVLDTASLEIIKAMRDDWKSLARKRFPGGRQTVDDDETPSDRTGERVVPDLAYMS